MWPQVCVLSLLVCLAAALPSPAAPGWSIWSGGMWNIPDDDGEEDPDHDGGGDHGVAGDNIPGVGGNDYPVKSQADLCALNPTNPGCWESQDTEYNTLV